MDDACRRFFLEPEQTFHRRYEALRAFFVEGQPLEKTAAQFGYRVAGLTSTISRFRGACRKDTPPPFRFRTCAAGRRGDDAPKTNTGRNRPTWPTPAS